MTRRLFGAGEAARTPAVPTRESVVSTPEPATDSRGSAVPPLELQQPSVCRDGICTSSVHDSTSKESIHLQSAATVQSSGTATTPALPPRALVGCHCIPVAAVSRNRDIISPNTSISESAVKDGFFEAAQAPTLPAVSLHLRCSSAADPRALEAKAGPRLTSPCTAAEATSVAAAGGRCLPLDGSPAGVLESTTQNSSIPVSLRDHGVARGSAVSVEAAVGGEAASPSASSHEATTASALVADARGGDGQKVSVASLLGVRWKYSSSDELLSSYMVVQRAAASRPEEHQPYRFKAAAKSYFVSLYRWGWFFWPVRCTQTWFAEAGPTILSGLFIPFSLVPTAMTCALISGLPVSAALNSCWIVSLITCLLGGAPGTVSAVTEAIATALVSTVTAECSDTECRYTGREFIFPAGILCGLLQCLFGLKGYGRYVSLVPLASRIGYINAVAILNCRSQLHAFHFDPLTSKGYEWLLVLWLMLQVCSIMYIWPVIAPCHLAAYLPASAVALSSSVFTEFLIYRRFCHTRTKTVGDVSALAGGGNLPSLFIYSPAFAVPSEQLLSLRGLYTLIEVSLTLVLLSSMSTLMTLEKLQERSKWNFRADRQLAALGIANTISSLLGCLPGTTGMMVSLLGNRMGAKSKEAPLLAAICLFVFTSVAYHVLDVIPLGGLSGAIVYTAVSAVCWRAVPPLISCLLPNRVSRLYKPLHQQLSQTEAAVVLLTTILGATIDLGLALLIGMFISLCSFTYDTARGFRVCWRHDAAANTSYCLVDGALFFATARQLSRHLNAQAAPQRTVVLLRSAGAASDYAVLMALRDIVKQYEESGKEIELYGVELNGEAAGLHAGRALEAAACVRRKVAE